MLSGPDIRSIGVQGYREAAEWAGYKEYWDTGVQGYRGTGIGAR